MIYENKFGGRFLDIGEESGSDFNICNIYRIELGWPIKYKEMDQQYSRHLCDGGMLFRFYSDKLQAEAPCKI
jgi:hypothetical protein